MTFDEFSKTGMADLLLIVNRLEKNLFIATNALKDIAAVSGALTSDIATTAINSMKEE